MAALEGDLLSAGGGGGLGGSFSRTEGRSDVRSDGSREGKDDVRTQFVTCEGTYRLMPLSEYGRPNRIQPTGSNNNTPVRVSFIKTPNNNTGGSKHDPAVDATTLSKGGSATPGSVNGPTVIGSTVNRPSSSTGGASSSIANGGIYVGWGGASSIGSPNGTTDFGGGSGGGTGWSTNSDIGGGVTATRLNGVQTTSWNNGGVGGGSAGNGGTSRTWNGGGSGGINDALSTEDKVCFNVGKELYVYHYNGVHKSVDLSRPIDKRLYRGTSPTCHDFNSVTCQLDRAMLVVGFTAGQVQLIDPIGKEISRLYNEERHIDKTRVTCIRWLPDSPNQFLVSHVSGQLYVYHEDLSCGTAPPVYQLFKSGEGFSVHTCKTKSTRNPLFRWLIDGAPSINEFAFSPCSRYLALVCGDGFLRVYNYDRLELVGTMKSYFGGLLCVAWSPDGRYIATGGEDDLVTVWSFVEQRVVCRGRGHTSWVNVVAFDPFTTIAAPVVVATVGSEEFDLSGSDEEVMRKSSNSAVTPPTVAVTLVSNENGAQSDSGCTSSNATTVEQNVSSYRFGSVGQDTVLCLWDLTEDLLRRQPSLSSRQARASVALSDVSTSMSASATASTNSSGAFSNHCVPTAAATSTTVVSDSNGRHDSSVGTTASSSATSSATSLSRKYASLSLNERDAAAVSGKHRHSHSVSAKSESSKLSVKSTMASLTSSDTSSASSPASSAKLSSASEAARLLGTVSCPGLHEVPLLEPLTCKKIAHERLSALVFRADCFVTACQEGNVYTWSRPAAWASGSAIPSADPGGS